MFDVPWYQNKNMMQDKHFMHYIEIGNATKWQCVHIVIEKGRAGIRQTWNVS